MVEIHSATVTDDIRIQYRRAGVQGPVLLLIHGYPETSYAWRKVIAPLTEAGFQLVMPDLRGIGGSSRPPSGYDNRTLADDLVAVLDHAGIYEPVTVVGHDIGFMVAYAFARFHTERTRKLIVIDAPLPGTQAFQNVWEGARAWHFHFHQAPDIPEELTFGREARYLERFYHDLPYNASAIDQEAFSTYVRAYSQPGAMRCGFNLYRTFLQDVEENKRALSERGKLQMPVLALAGEISPYASVVEEMMLEFAEQVSAAIIPRTGHWIAEENPQDLSQAIVQFAK